MQIITTCVQKGGVGKTTTAAVLAQAAAYKGKKVLAVDLDPQANLTFALGAQAATLNSYHLFDGTPAAALIQKTGQGVDVIPASMNLATIRSGQGSALRIKTALEPLKRQYDYIFIDTPSQPGELQYNALQAATGAIFPLQADTFNIQSFYQSMKLIKQIQKTNKRLKILGLILTMHNERTRINKQLAAAMINEAEKANVPYLGAVRSAVAVQEAAALRKSLYQYAPKSKPAADYLQIFEQLDR